MTILSLKPNPTSSTKSYRHADDTDKFKITETNATASHSVLTAPITSHDLNLLGCDNSVVGRVTTDGSVLEDHTAIRRKVGKHSPDDTRSDLTTTPPREPQPSPIISPFFPLLQSTAFHEFGMQRPFIQYKRRAQIWNCDFKIKRPQ
jgi:hypothetical protein